MAIYPVALLGFSLLPHKAHQRMFQPWRLKFKQFIALSPFFIQSFSI
jgi:hypothetical protein